MRQLALLLCVTASTVLCGCGAALERAGVSRDFAAQFGCQAHKVSALGSGYRVEGCGRVASYACIDTPHHYHWDDSTTKVGHGELAGAVVAAVIAGSLHADKCFLSYAERFDRAPRLVSGAAASVYRKQAAPQVPLLVVTRGAHGALAIQGGERTEVGAEPIETVVDTTGAGDLFAAGFLAGLAEGRSIRDCLTMGAVCAREIIA